MFSKISVRFAIIRLIDNSNSRVVIIIKNVSFDLGSKIKLKACGFNKTDEVCNEKSRFLKLAL